MIINQVGGGNDSSESRLYINNDSKNLVYYNGNSNDAFGIPIGTWPNTASTQVKIFANFTKGSEISETINLYHWSYNAISSSYARCLCDFGNAYVNCEYKPTSTLTNLDFGDMFKTYDVYKPKLNVRPSAQNLYVCAIGSQNPDITLRSMTPVHIEGKVDLSTYHIADTSIFPDLDNIELPEISFDLNKSTVTNFLVDRSILKDCYYNPSYNWLYISDVSIEPL